MAMATETNEKKNNDRKSQAMSPLFTGRKTIYYDAVDLSVDANVITLVERTMIAHALNRRPDRKSVV